ncbi:hypothetical protein ACTFIW_000791 [Dictyostelium discoideum]
MTTISNKFSTFFTQNVPDFFHASCRAVSTKSKLCGRGVSNFTRMLHDKTDLQINSWIALPLAILTIFTAVLKHIGVAAKIGLIYLRTFNGLVLAETIRKICKKEECSYARSGYSILTYLPLGLPGIIANLSMHLFASLLNVVHHYVPSDAARETIVDKTLWWFDKLYVDLPISHVVSVLNSFNSFIHFGSEVTIKKITQAADKIRLVSQSFTHAGYELGGASTFLDITDLLSGEVGCEDGKEKGINFLKEASTILLIVADLLGHVSFWREIAGFGLGQIQLGIMGSILDYKLFYMPCWIELLLVSGVLGVLIALLYLAFSFQSNQAA